MFKNSLDHKPIADYPFCWYFTAVEEMEIFRMQKCFMHFLRGIHISGFYLLTETVTMFVSKRF